MKKLGIACMPLFMNVPELKNSSSWTKTTCTVCGRLCWETDTYKLAKKAGIITSAACTECAMNETISGVISDD